MAIGGFSVCLPYTLREEGGESNDPRDPGGHTNKGVTQTRYDQYRSAKRMPRQSVSRISDTELEDIYRHSYWDAVKGEKLRPGEDLSAFDFAVNSGPARATSALGKANLGSPPITKVIENIAAIRLSFLHALVTWSAFGKGWGARVARIEAASLKMAGLPIAPHAVAAKARQKASATAAKGSAAAAPAGAAGAHHFLEAPASVAALIFAAMLVAAAAAAYAAWRQSQRAATLNNAAAAQAAAAAQLATKFVSQAAGQQPKS
ncbi:protein of unknown function DUF847 [Methylocella silvestris BL2]|uniref:TtsA-like Glycoside hydrolase family 108 domain-containing protein n=1 Tax=Methylocella silvestris (strain DSM 15510 / CIP 108128 / LMG 27833 / NCIMB 13906 / BL2) TaxID=395965 RepID=B8EKU5_METSB|nr:glycosyl hydrolase 108 family protein [Methylocella silvestris]ACK51973.1 protein of unknown function DUF847 [Methylocella silvestris BL2]